MSIFYIESVFYVLKQWIVKISLHGGEQMSLKMMPSVLAQSTDIDINAGTGYSGTERTEADFDIDVVVAGQTGAGQTGHTDAGEHEEEISDAEAKRRIKSVIDQANEKIKQQNGYRRLAFSYNKETKKISIKVYDEMTKEIIREIPPERTNVILNKIHDLAGIVVDEKR